MNILIISPLYDVATWHSDYLADELADLCRQRQHYVRHLDGFKAHPWLVRGALAEGHWDLFVYFGHGEHDSLNTLFGKIITPKHAHLFKDVMVYCMACSMGRDLAPALVQGGARAVIGNSDGVYGATKSLLHNFGADFKFIWHGEVGLLLDGQPVATAVQWAIGQWNQLYAQYLERCHQLVRLQTWCDYADRAKINGAFHSYWGDGSAGLPV